MMAEIGFNLSVYAVPVIPGRLDVDDLGQPLSAAAVDGDPYDRAEKRIARLGDQVPLGRTPAPRVRPAAALAPLCDHGIRGHCRTS